MDGKLAESREDALGRRVMARTSNFPRFVVMARAARSLRPPRFLAPSALDFHTRFELDVDLDHDNDGTKVILVDGGIRSNGTAAPGLVDQQASWPSRIERAKHPLDTLSRGATKEPTVAWSGW